jgi:hypothetical protein
MNEKPFEVPLGQRQLFLDDHGITEINELHRTMHRPEKKGAVIEPSGDERHISVRSAPAWDPEARCYKLWIAGDGGIGLAESADGVNWERPILRVREHKGSLENNLVVGPCGEHVVFDPADPDPSRRYKSLRLGGSMERVVSPSPDHWKLHHNPWRLAYHSGHVLNDPRQYQLSWVIQVKERPGAPADERFEGMGRFQTRDLVVSADGIHWRKLDDPGLPTGDEGNFSLDEETGTYIATLKEGEMGPFGRSISLATSKDFQRWTQPELVFHADEKDQELNLKVIAERLDNPSLTQPQYNVPAEYFVDVYNMGVFRYEGLYIGLPAFFHHTGDVNENSDGFHRVQLTTSRDLHTWARLGEREPFIGPSTIESGAYDLNGIMPSSKPILKDDALWFYYPGSRYRQEPPDADPKRSAACLAVLRRDGFISLDAGSSQGTVLTETFLLPSPWLFINVDATGGSVEIEVLDAAGGVIAESEPIRGDHPRYPVQWRGDPAASVNRPVQLRLKANDASVYSYWFDEVTEPPPH